MFGSFALTKAKGKARDDVALKVVYDVCTTNHKYAYWFIHTVGWINPFNFAYVLYLKSDNAYWYAVGKQLEERSERK